MKVIRYNLCNRNNIGTEEKPVWEEILTPVFMQWSEFSEQIAKQEAHNGEYVIEDDGQPEPETDLTVEEQIAQLQEALDLLLSGVTE